MKSADDGLRPLHLLSHLHVYLGAQRQKQIHSRPELDEPGVVVLAGIIAQDYRRIRILDARRLSEVFSSLGYFLD